MLINKFFLNVIYGLYLYTVLQLRTLVIDVYMKPWTLNIQVSFGDIWIEGRDDYDLLGKRGLFLKNICQINQNLWENTFYRFNDVMEL